jgi:hypothetical protein
LELLLNQIKLTEAERDALLAVQQTAASPPAGRMLLDFKGIGAEFAAVLWLRGFSASSTIGASLPLTPDSRRRPGRAD